MGLAGKYRATDPIYIAALNGATDLFTLGQKEGSTLSAAKALQVVNLQVKAEDKEKYQNAIKGYFVDDWFQVTIISLIMLLKKMLLTLYYNF